jgi:hypothetical protein
MDNLQFYQHQINLLLNDESIKTYFKTTNKNLFDFVKTYIEVDKILGSSLSSKSNLLLDKLDEIKNSIQTNYNQLSTIHQNVSASHSNLTNLIQSKLDSINSNIKDITNTDIKNMFIELHQQLSSGIDNNNLRELLENFKDKIENLNVQKLNDFDRKTLDMISNIQNTMLQSLDTHSISHKISSIETNLSTLNEHFSNNSSKKGQLAEHVLLNILTEAFSDTEVLDTSHIPNSGDIQLIKNDKPNILIDSKHFGSKTVPKRDLDKFYSDIQHHNCSGILCNAFGGIANKQHFEIDIVDKNIIVFIHSHQFDQNLFRLAVNIIYNMHQQIKDQQNECIKIDQRLYQNLKIEYNYYIQSFRHHLDIIKTNVNSLSQLSFTLLDNFFKRKATSLELKAFTCHLCGTGCSTEKILKTHIRNKHSKKQDDTDIEDILKLPTITQKTQKHKQKQKQQEFDLEDQKIHDNNIDINDLDNF